MGILKLNELFKRCFTEAYGKKYDVVIIDGSNIIFQTLCSQLSKLKKSSIITQWQSVNLDLMTQISYIITYSIQDITDTINKYFDQGVSEIIMVIDPVEEPCYNIDTSYQFNHAYQDLIDEDLKNGITIELHIKSEEQEKRRTAANKTDDKQQRIAEILQLDELTTEQKQILSTIFSQSFMFNENRQLLILANYIIKTVHRLLKDKNFKLIQAKDEADLVIKNIGESFHNDEQILILSMDTDYNVLFGCNPNVNTCSLTNRYTVYNPYKCWKALFADSPAFDFDHVIRLAPLFGNDYTVKEYLVSAPNFEDVLTLYEARLQELKEGKGTKKITKFVKTITLSNDDMSSLEGELLDLDLLDKFIHDWNINYFEKYYRSNIIYTNWNKYNRYEEIPTPDEDDCVITLDETLTKLFNSFTIVNVGTLTGGSTNPTNDKETNNQPTNDNNQTNANEQQPTNAINHVLYKWKPDLIFSDWERFFKELEVVPFDSIDTYFQYYYDNEYRDEAAGFLDEQ